MSPPADEVKDRVRSILARIAELEDELEAELHEREEEFRYKLRERKVQFEQDARKAHRRLQVGLTKWLAASQPRNVISAPFIYSLIVPIALLDLWVTIYQALCFPLYQVPKVERTKFIVVDRHRLAYLNIIEKLNCVYCGYATGVLAYTREIAARTEQYWCPIKHARKTLGMHARHAEFLDYGDPADLAAQMLRMRSELRCSACAGANDACHDGGMG